MTIFQSLRKYRFLINQLLRVKLLVDFKKSYVGGFWLIILPLVSIITWIFMKNSGVIKPGDTGVSYPAFVFFSTSTWAFFIESYRKTSRTINENGKIMLANKIPVDVFLATNLVVLSIRLSIPLLLGIIVFFIFGVPQEWSGLLLPISLIPLMLLGFCIGLIVSIFRVVAVDLANIVDEMMKLLLFFTPVLYSAKIRIGFLGEFIQWNPLTYLIEMPRSLLFKGEAPDFGVYLTLCFGILGLTALVLQFYRRMAPQLLERLINQ